MGWDSDSALAEEHLKTPQQESLKAYELQLREIADGQGGEAQLDDVDLQYSAERLVYQGFRSFPAPALPVRLP
jgi:hypothetical protein